MRETRGGGGRSTTGGVPDGLLIGVLGFLLGLTLLVWAATGLAGLFAHGAWPTGLTFTRTPSAMRRLFSQPHDIAAAWPDTPPEQLSGYGLFWGTFISELMVLFVLAIFAIGTLARWKARRAGRGARPAAETAPEAGTGRGPAPVPAPGTPAEAPHGPAPATLAEAGREPGPPPPGEAATSRQAATEAAWAPLADAGTDRRTTDAGTAPQAAWAPTGAPEAPPAREEAASAPPAPSAAHTPHPEPRSAALGLRFTGPRTRATAPHPLAVQAVREAAGPVLVVTSDPALWAETKDARAKLGPVHVHDPGHLIDTPARLRWSPATGCESRTVAAVRAAALLAPVRPVHALDSATADAAETLLRCWLHAAAVDGRPFRQVHRWAQGAGAHEPVRILRTHPKAAGGAAGELEATLTGHPERRDQAQQLTARALGALSSVHIRNACTPNRADLLAVESFVAEGGTLYVVGEANEDPRTRPGAMPLLTALTSSVVEHGRRMAARSSSGRLDPPLTLVLDDIAAVAPFPQFPELLAAGAEQGLPLLALLRSEEQARARWPHRPFAP
ncbi:type VI secretion protein [Streptomyces sp. URMC 123]|uniref:type IV secretory system conjugative DNA transfer family protein n=1 Tax=Streptomyces sp. URMC 123 TaxID=3423403 RepID=UPI003F1CFA51